MNNKIGRNDPCLCGSGKKYKKCCLSSSSPISSSAIKLSENRLKDAIEKQCNSNDEIRIMGQTSEIKMSEIILDLIDDFLQGTESRNEMSNIITVTCMAWNLSILVPREKHEDEIERLMDTLEINLSEERDEMKIFIERIIGRKLIKYPNIRRSILNHDLIGTPGNFHLNVASVLDSEEIKSIENA